MSELTEFLLARIAEDEATATNWLRFEVRDGIPGNYAIPERVRAECEAKRHILEALASVVEQASGQVDAERFGDDLIAWSWATALLRWLALPYADHPDYRQEWKP